MNRMTDEQGNEALDIIAKYLSLQERRTHTIRSSGSTKYVDEEIAGLSARFAEVLNSAFAGKQE